MALCGPDGQGYGGAGAVADFEGEGGGGGGGGGAVVDADYEVVPGVDGDVGVFVPEDLEAGGAIRVVVGGGGGVGVEAGDEAV